MKINITVQKGEKLINLENELIKNYKLFQEKDRDGLWFKVLRRYYTVFKRIRSKYLMQHIIRDLEKYPTLDEKISPYLLH